MQSDWLFHHARDWLVKKFDDVMYFWQHKKKNYQVSWTIGVFFVLFCFFCLWDFYGPRLSKTSFRDRAEQDSLTRSNLPIFQKYWVLRIGRLSSDRRKLLLVISRLRVLVQCRKLHDLFNSCCCSCAHGQSLLFTTACRLALWVNTRENDPLASFMR